MDSNHRLALIGSFAPPAASLGRDPYTHASQPIFQQLPLSLSGTWAKSRGSSIGPELRYVIAGTGGGSHPRLTSCVYPCHQESLFFPDATTIPGGEGEIRTHGPRYQSPGFKAGALGHSATSPMYLLFIYCQRKTACPSRIHPCHNPPAEPSIDG